MDTNQKFEELGGIIPAVGEEFIPATESEIASLEGHFQARLPDAYRHFLLSYGASAFEEYVDFKPLVQLPEENWDTGYGHFSLFYGSEAPAHEGYGLLRRLRFFGGRIPENFLPIGDCGNADQICLCMSGSDKGRVFLLDLENEPLTEEEYLADYGEPMPAEYKVRNIYLIAESFEDFLQRLVVSEDG